MGVFDSLIEASGCTDYNAKNLNSLQCNVAEEEKLFKKNYPFLKMTFLVFVFNFLSNCTFKELRFFAL